MNRITRLEIEYDCLFQGDQTARIETVAQNLQAEQFLGNFDVSCNAPLDDFVEIVDAIPKTQGEIEELRTDCCFCGLDLGTAEVDVMLNHFYSKHPKDMSDCEAEADKTLARAEEEEEKKEMGYYE